MITRRPSEERGHVNHGWLDTRHTFSFADYHDPDHMGFRSLRVINEDRVRPGEGFGTHSHRDMEIVTCVLEGALAHRDSMGNGSTIRPHEVQRMSAGTGVAHSEHNASRSEPVHFLQIWILPKERGLAPGYEQRTFPPEEKRGLLRLIGSEDGRDGSVTIHQDVDLFASIVDRGEGLEHRLRPGRHAWIQVTRGALSVNGTALEAGDGASVTGDERLTIEASEPSEFLLFDLA